MIKKNTIFDYLMHTMVIWGISTLSLCLFCLLFGESAKGYSSIFEFGNTGISLSTLFQFLSLSIIISSLKWIFFTDIVIKKLTILWRIIFMFSGVIVSVGILASVFRWFPVNQVMPWVMFLICFLVCAAVSAAVSVLKEKTENEKMQEALTRLKGEDFK